MNKGKKIIICILAALVLVLGTGAGIVHTKQDEPTIQGQFVKIPTDNANSEETTTIEEQTTIGNENQLSTESTTTITEITTNTTTTKPNKEIKPTTTTTKKPTTTTTTTKQNNYSSEIYMGRFRLTYYCPCYICSEGYGRGTATGTIATEGRTIAVDPNVIPYGSKVKIVVNGKEHIYIAEDCGGAINNNRIDIFVESHSRAEDLGVQYGEVYIVK